MSWCGLGAHSEGMSSQRPVLCRDARTYALTGIRDGRDNDRLTCVQTSSDHSKRFDTSFGPRKVQSSMRPVHHLSRPRPRAGAHRTKSCASDRMYVPLLHRTRKLTSCAWGSSRHTAYSETTMGRAVRCTSSPSRAAWYSFTPGALCGATLTSGAVPTHKDLHCPAHALQEATEGSNDDRQHPGLGIHAPISVCQPCGPTRSATGMHGSHHSASGVLPIRTFDLDGRKHGRHLH